MRIVIVNQTGPMAYIIIMAGMAVFLRGWLPHRGKAQMACNYCFPTTGYFLGIIRYGPMGPCH